MKRRSGLIALMLVVLMLLQSVAYATEADLNAGTPLADYTLGDYIEDQEAAALAASAEESAEPTYLEQIAALQAQAEALDPESETLTEDVCAIYDEMMAVADAAQTDWENDVITEDECMAVMEAAAALETYLVNTFGFDTYTRETGARPGQGTQPGGEATESGTMDHIEIEVDGTATIVVDDVEYEESVTISTNDEFTIIAEYTDAEGNYSKVTLTADSGTSSIAGSDVYYTENTTGDGSNDSATVELTGNYPTGTYDYPVYYTIQVTRNITFYLRDSEGNMLDANGNVTTDESAAVVIVELPITLSVKIHYWDFENNECPGCYSQSTSGETTTSTPREDWYTNHKYTSGSGIDVAISGEGDDIVITQGKLAINKKVTNDSDDTTEFTFYVQNSEGKYVVFEGTEYKSLSDTLTDDCYVTVNAGSTVTLTEFPAGGYKVTEVQKEGYIIANVNGTDTSTNYSTDYIEVDKEDETIPVAMFSNKVLEEEAGISINKVARGASPLPNPTVSIYAADANGNPTGSALWMGQLTANGDTLYLNTTLTAGTYVIVETGQEVPGYSCTTTLAGGETVNGMVFTVVAGKRYDLTVTNVYENVTSVTVNKQWADDSVTDGETTTVYDTRPASVEVTLYANGTAVADSTVTLSADNGWTYTWPNLPRSENGAEIAYTVIETEVKGYNTTGGTVVDGTATIVNTLDTTDVTLKKLVAGNMGDQSKEFTFTVSVTDANGKAYNYFTITKGDTTYAAGTTTVNLAHNQTATIGNVPVGGTITVTETDSGYTSTTWTVVNGETTKSGDKSLTATDSIVADGDIITFTNTKNQSVDTGVTLDSMPYMLLLAAGAGLMMLAARRRRTDN